MTNTKSNLTIERIIRSVRKLDACGPYYRREVAWLVVQNADSVKDRTVLHCHTRRKDAKRQIRVIESFGGTLTS